MAAPTNKFEIEMVRRVSQPDSKRRRIYIADTGDSRCALRPRRSHSESAVVRPNRWARLSASPVSLTSCPLSTDSCGDGGPATGAMLNSPAGISLDGSGNGLHISDTGDNRIQ